MKSKFFLTICSILLLLFITSCAAKNTSQIRENHKVTQIFRSYTVVPDYNYYYYGIPDLPDAIIGIDKKLTVQSRLWQNMTLTEESLNKLVIDLDRFATGSEFAPQYNNRYRGAYIFDPEGNNVGIWYSKYDWGVFEFQEPDIIIPYAPSLSPGSQILAVPKIYND